MARVSLTFTTTPLHRDQTSGGLFDFWTRFRGAVSIFSRLEITRHSHVNYREFLDIRTTDVATMFWANASRVWMKDNIAKILEYNVSSVNYENDLLLRLIFEEFKKL